jgi:hypothetical protein
VLRKETMRHWTRSLALDATKNIRASYADGGEFQARRWPAPGRALGKKGMPRWLLVGNPELPLKINDRIECADGLYNILKVGAYPRHCEALLEREELQA